MSNGSPLSERDWEVLRRLALPTDDIAAACNYSRTSIERVVERVRERLGAESKAVALILALKQGWLSLNDVVVERDGA